MWIGWAFIWTGWALSGHMGPYLDIWAYIWKIGLKVERVGSYVNRVGFYLHIWVFIWQMSL